MTAEERLTNIISGIFKTMPAYLDEKQRRILSGCIADSYGRGGIQVVCKASGQNYRTIKDGIADINNSYDNPVPAGKIRRAGAGRPGIEAKYPNIKECVESILSTNTYGDPERVLTWTNLSLRDIVSELEKQFQIKTNKNVVANIMEDFGYSRQVNQKLEQVGSQHPDRDAQFQFINDTAKAYIDQMIPVISVDTKKKGTYWQFQEQWSRVQTN